MARIAAAFVAALASALLLAPILLVALAARAVAVLITAGGRALEPRHGRWSDLMRFDAVLGWKPRANLDAHYLVERDDVHHVVTDAEGWPGRHTVEKSDVIVIGDSFAFAYGIDAERAFFARITSPRIKAVGAPGYSMVQGVRLMEALGTRLAGKLVVWLPYLENDLQDNLAPNLREYRAPFLRRSPGGDGWEIATGHVSPAPWTCSRTNRLRFDTLAACCVPGPIADRAYSACNWLITRADSVCRRAGAQLVVVTVPHRMLLHDDGHAWLAALTPTPEAFDPSLPDRRIGATCDRLGVRFVAGRCVFEHGDYKVHEGIHWNARGHRRMAKLLQRLHASSGKAATTTPELAGAT